MADEITNAELKESIRKWYQKVSSELQDVKLENEELIERADKSDRTIEELNYNFTGLQEEVNKLKRQLK